MESLIWLIPLLPIFGFVFNVFIGRLMPKVFVSLEPSELIADDELRSALRALAPRDREALLLTSWFDLSPADAAAAVGVTAAAFRMRLARARRRLRAELPFPESLPKERARCDIPETM